MRRDIIKSLKIASARQDKGRDYWLSKLAGDLAKSYFPYDFEITGKAKGETSEMGFRFVREISGQLLKLSSNSDALLYIILLAVVMTLVHKYTGNTDIIVAAPVQKSNVDGELLNSVLALRNLVQGNLTFKELLLQLRQTTIEAAENQNYPLEVLLEKLSPSLSEADFSLFEIAVLLENIHERNYLQSFDLNMVFRFTRKEKEIEGIIEYNTMLYSEPTIKRIISHLSILLGNALSHVNYPLKELDVLSNVEKEELISDFNNTASKYPKDKTIHQLFEGQVEQTPNNIAVIFRHEHLTYRELNSQTDRMAKILRQKGIRQDIIAAIMMERSLRMEIGIMAILKAGGAYLPIELDFPIERVNYMLKETEATLLLSRQDNIKKYNNLEFDGELLDIYSLDLNRVNNEELTNENFPDSLAYVMYTSGSTGKPKGVLIEHKNVINFMSGIALRINFETGKSILAITTITFDISILELLLPLTRGLKVVIAPDNTKRDPDRMKEIISRYGIQMLQLTPSLLRALVDIENNWYFLEVVNELMVGGEAFPQDLHHHLKEIYGGKLYNLYGPTETTVWSTVKELTKSPHDKIDIGGPISNTQVYIVGEYGKPLPIGSIGELYIGGDGVARGYLNNSELTDRSFIPNPFKPGERLYKTGDIGRRLPDGNIEWLGRKDHQVKIRGYRIELGEIESKLIKHPGVKESVVMIREVEKNEKYLCAYIIAYSNDLSLNEIKEYLSEKLPGYMVPSFFVQLEKLPLTPTGKVDRKALPEPDRSGLNYVSPRDEVERKLTEMWGDLLGIEKFKIGIDDNFFNIGGNSLDIIRISTQIRKDFNVELRIVDIFNAPTIRSMAALIHPHKKEEYISIPPTSKRDYYQLSSAQRRLYFLQELDRQSTVYNLQYIAELRGDIDKDKMEKTFRELIKRHESLRTRFFMLQDEPVQKIEREVPFNIEYYEKAEERSQEDVLNTFIRPFKLDAAPLLRVGLQKLEARNHLFIMDIHHIIADGTALQILIQEFMKIHNKEYLPVLKLHYKDYSEWQKIELESEFIKKQKIFWQAQFEFDIPVIELPTDFVRPPALTFQGRAESFEIAPAEVKKLRLIATTKEVTLFMVLLAVYNVFLFKLTNQEDIVVGTPVANRRHPDVEKIIGMVANTLPLRNFPSPGKTFEDFLEEVKERSVQAFENQDFPYEELVELAVIGRDYSRNPLFDVMVVFQNMDIPVKEIPGLTFADIKFERKTSKFDLSLEASEWEEKFGLTFEYCTDLFKNETIRRFIEYFKQIVKEITTNPAIPIKTINLVDEKKKQEIISFTNQIKFSPISYQVIHRWFEEKAGRMEEEPALIIEENTLSYKELDKKSNLLGKALRGHGIEPNSIVGLMASRSFETIIGILAVLKAGGAYLPLEPGFPPERQKYMIKDSNLHLLLTDSEPGKAGLNGLFEGVDIINIKDDDLYQGNISSIGNVNESTDLVYIIYTSGSTGSPKGIMMEHRNLINLIAHHINYSRIDCTRVLQLAALSFDVSFQEIFSTLLSGGRLYLNNVNKLDIIELFRVIEENEIKTVFLTPSFLTTAFDNDDTLLHRPRCLRHIVAAGEKLVVNSRLREYFQENDILLHNHYGPTETHVATELTISPKDDIPDYPSIGRPVMDTRVYILDNYFNWQAIGIPGELFIGGPQVGRGYLGKPELTARKFLYIDPLQPSSPKIHVYRTGDRARWLENGNIEFLGRTDSQVKIRGYRVEPAEVEHQLLKICNFKAALVVPFKHNDQVVLISYIVPGTGQKVDFNKLKAPLSERLPEYMIPRNFIELKQIPLTAHGKIDRKALPDPKLFTDAEVSKLVFHLNDTEDKLAEIWSRVLGMEKSQIHVNTDFFKAGGTSIKAIPMIAKIRTQFGINLPLADIYRNNTIKTLAESLLKPSTSDRSPIRPAARKNYYKLSSMQMRLCVFHQNHKNNTAYNMPAVVILLGDVNRNKLQETFDELIERHESFKTSFEVVDSEFVQRIHRDVDFKLEYVDLGEAIPSGIDEDEQVRNFVKPFDLSKPPLMRAKLLKKGKNEHILMIDMPHIISDRDSWGIFLDDFSKIYKEIDLPGLDFQYKDFAEWQAKPGDIQSLKEQEEYWLKQFDGEIPCLELPIDKMRPSEKTFAGNTCNSDLDGEINNELKVIESIYGINKFDFWFSTYLVFLAKLSTQQDIIVGIPRTRRVQPEIENLIGMFVDMLVLRNIVPLENKFCDFCKQVSINKDEAIKNSEYQLADLLKKLKVRGDKNRNLLFDVSFDYQDAKFNDEIEINGLKLQPYKTEEIKKSSKFDLTLYVFSVDKNRIHLVFEYSTELFEKESMQRFMGYYKEIVSQVLEKPGLRIAEIDLVSEVEKEKILFEFNRNIIKFPEDKTIHYLFQELAENKNDITAVTFEEDHIKYGGLNENANRLARKLREKGIKPDTIAALMVERSIKMITGILGILKAGAAYLPVLPDEPTARKKHVLDDSAVTVIVTSGKYSEELREYLNTPGSYEIINLDSPELCEMSKENLVEVTRPDYPAYVIYTSGAMGKPKGVVVEHKNIINLIYGLKNNIFPKTNASLRISLVASYTFDASVQQIFGSLLLGHSLYIVPEETKKDGTSLFEFYQKHKIEVSDGTPAHLSLLIQALPPKPLLLDMKIFLIGGEILPQKYIERFLNNFGKKYPQIVNVYGPTECCVDATFYPISDQDKTEPRAIPIGKPMPNIRTLILGLGNKLQPIGVPGELCISGVAVTRGYVNNEELTAEKFVSDPFTKRHDNDDLNNKMYRTGDRVKWLSDGNIEFLGRVDRQLKIRGYRVEPGEIERQLLSNEKVKSAVVMGINDASENMIGTCSNTFSCEAGNISLCAYVVPLIQDELKKEEFQEELKVFLKARLPLYMIPSYFVLLSDLPLTSGWKIDIEQLPKPVKTSRKIKALPRNQMDKDLVEALKKVIGDEIGIYDDLGSVGIESIKKTEFYQLAAKKVNVRIDVTCKANTIASLSDEIIKKKKLKDEEEVKKRLNEASKPEVEELDLSGLNLTRIPGEVFELTQLKSLILGYSTKKNNRITSIPKEISMLSNLTKLRMDYNQLTELPKELYDLEKLTELSIINNKLTEIPNGIGRLTNLKKLYIDTNHLNRIPKDIFQLENLEVLSLSNNFLTELPYEIAKLRKLENLDASNNELKELPKEITKLEKLTKVNFINNPLDNPPLRLVKGGMEAIRNHFKSIEKEYAFLYELRLIVVGERNVGKTWIIKKLTNSSDDLKVKNNNTDAVSYKSSWEIAKEELNFPENIKLHVWEIGSREISKNALPFFLTNRSLYLYLIDARNENEITEFNHFLEMSAALGIKSPILIALHKCDQYNKINVLPILDYQEKFKNIKDLIKTSCSVGYEDKIETLNAEIKRIITNKDLFPHIGFRLPRGWASVRTELNRIKSKGNKIIACKDYLEICRRCNIDEKRAHTLLDIFNNLGFLFYFKGVASLEETIFLDGAWIARAVDSVFSDNVIINHKGRISNEDISNALKNFCGDDMQCNLLKELIVLESSGLGLKLKNGQSLFPHLLPEKVEYELDWNGKDNVQLIYVYKLFMPEGIITRLIAAKYDLIYQGKIYWKHGLILEDMRTRAHIVEHHKEKRIIVAVEGENKARLLSIVREAINEIHIILNNPEVEEVVPCVCKDCQGSGKPYLYSYVALNKALANNSMRIPCGHSGLPISINLLLEGVEKEASEVFNDNCKIYGKQVNIAEHIGSINK